MSSPLRLLHIEDNPLDCELIQRLLTANGFVCETVRVDTQDAMLAALQESRFDLIFCDYTMPTFDGRTALAIARERCPEIPFIFVSGTIGEDHAVESLHRGATDYVLKDRLTRLPDVVRRALNEVRERSERRRAEDALQRLAAILDATTDCVATADKEGHVQYINQGGRRLLGIAEDEDVTSTHIPDYHPEWAGTLVMAEGLPASVREGAWRGDTALLTRDGRVIPVSQIILCHKDAAGEVDYYSTIARDMSEQQRLEAQLRQAQKMEAVGRLAGGVAHDFNNMLMIIKGYSDLLLSRDLDAQVRKKVEEIRKAGDRAAGLTRQLLAFSRKQVLQPAILDLKTVLANLGTLLQRVIGEDIDIRTLSDPTLGQVKADQGQIEQVVMNLVTNARDAMPHGGHLTIELRNVDLDEAYAQHHIGATPGRYVMLAASDTGCGMDRATLARIFEPFFTTKAPGKGTGLGLATVYGIVKQSGGYIWADSEPGHGTTFQLYLPRTDEAATASPMRATGEAVPSGTETILLVEDEEKVRHLVSEMLTHYGYTVLIAPNGQEALRVAQDYTGVIHLLVTDVVMPEMSGPELTRRVTLMRPEVVKVLYMSGYTDDAIVHHGVLDADMPFLQKPFSPMDLMHKIREVLAHP
ncbi:MAG: response regulator [Nitrospirota bacterium]|nr:response regulator [Nitrospirota bacterium]